MLCSFHRRHQFGIAHRRHNRQISAFDTGGGSVHQTLHDQNLLFGILIARDNLFLQRRALRLQTAQYRHNIITRCPVILISRYPRKPTQRSDILNRTSYIVPLYIALLLFLLRWIIQTAVINISARRMGLKGFNMFSILWFDIVLPLINLWMLILPKRSNKW